MKYQCNYCKKEFEIPGEVETHTTSNYYAPIQPQGTVINFTTPVITTIIRKKICPYCHQLDFHELKEG